MVLVSLFFLSFSAKITLPLKGLETYEWSQQSRLLTSTTMDARTVRSFL